jgi:lambda repressor-like predicted transcriptional regulator
MINKTYDMSPLEIRIALMRAGITQAEIARQTKVVASHVCRVIDGIDSNDRVRRAIAAAIGIDIKRVWPSIYLYGEARKPGRPKIESSFML